MRLESLVSTALFCCNYNVCIEVKHNYLLIQECYMYKRIIYKSLTMSLALFVFILSVPGFAQDNISVIPLFEQAHANAIYEVKFTTSQALSPNVKFLITFPGNFDLSKVNMAGSETMNGGFKTTVEDSTVLIERSGLGRMINAGEAVQLQFATVRNPGVVSDYVVKVEVLSDSDNRITQNESTVKIKMRTEKK